MKNNFKLEYVDQNWDGIEGWVVKENEFKVRLDALLEYYISKNVELTYSIIKGKTKNISYVKKYSSSLFEKFLKLTNEGREFDYDKYMKWQKTDNPKIVEKVIKLMNE